MNRLRGLTDLVEDVVRTGRSTSSRFTRAWRERRSRSCRRSRRRPAGSQRGNLTVIATTYDNIRETSAADGALVRACIDAADTAPRSER